MAYLEDILPEIRKGRGVRRKAWSSDTNPVTLKSTLWIEFSQMMADDWELVPEPVKVKAKIDLWNSGEVTVRKYDVVPYKKLDIVETREIEWSVE